MSHLLIFLILVSAFEFLLAKPQGAIHGQPFPGTGQTQGQGETFFPVEQGQVEGGQGETFFPVEQGQVEGGQGETFFPVEQGQVEGGQGETFFPVEQGQVEGGLSYDEQVQNVLSAAEQRLLALQQELLLQKQNPTETQRILDLQREILRNAQNEIANLGHQYVNERAEEKMQQFSQQTTPFPGHQGQMPNGQMPNGQMPNGQMPNGQMPNGQGFGNACNFDIRVLGNKQFHMSHNTYSFEDAYALCQRCGHQLADVTSSHIAATSTDPQANTFWIGSYEGTSVSFLVFGSGSFPYVVAVEPSHRHKAMCE